MVESQILKLGTKWVWLSQNSSGVGYEILRINKIRGVVAVQSEARDNTKGMVNTRLGMVQHMAGRGTDRSSIQVLWVWQGIKIQSLYSL